RGIPCFYKEDTSEIEEMLKTERSFLACAQTGTVVAWDPEIPADSSVSKGYAVHPAKAAASVANYRLPRMGSVQRQEAPPEEIKSLLNRIRSEETEVEALRALQELKG